MMPLHHILANAQPDINAVNQTFCRNEKELETLIYKEDTGVEFSIEKCTMQVMKSDKRYIRKESNYQIKLSSECSEKRKPTNTWGYWNLIPSNNSK